MTSRARIILRTPADRDRAQRAVGEASLDTVVTIAPATRRDRQNRLWRAMLDELAGAVVVDAHGRKLTHDEWADVFVGSKWGWSTHRCPLSGREIARRRSTAHLTVEEMSDLIEFTAAEAGTELGHTWCAYRPGDPEWEAARAKREDAA